MRALSPAASILFFLLTSPLHAAYPTLSGLVVDEAGAPLAGAKVELSAPGSRQRLAGGERTGAEGRFRIQTRWCAHLHLEVSRPGYAPASVSVYPCEKSPDYRIVLRAGAVASGRIVAADGKPVEGAWVALVPSGAPPGEPTPNRARTGADGRFTLRGHLPGVYDLRAAHPEHPRLLEPGIGIPAATPKVELGVFALRKPQRVEGRVVDQQGNPVEGVRILSPQSGPLDIQAAPVTGPDGRFALPEPVFGRLTLCKAGYDSAWGPLAIPARPSNLARIVLPPAKPPFRVSGRVVDEAGRPVPGAQLRGRPHENGCTMSKLVDACTGEDIPDQVMTSDADGRFTMEWTQEVFDIEAEAPGYLSAAQSRVSASGSRITGIELVLRRSLVVTGRVLARDGSPAVGARVFRFQNPSSPEAVTDAQGRYRLAGLSPERYVLEARHPELGQAVRRLEVSSGVNSLDFRLDDVPERALAGRVLDPSGQPLPGAHVSLDGYPWAWSDGEGRFRLVLGPDWQPKTAEAATLWVTHDDFPRASLEIRPSETYPQDLEIRLAPGQSVTGRLLGENDPERLANATVNARKGSESRKAQVTREGRYLLEGLRAGEWMVWAEIQGYKSAALHVSLEPGQEETFLDLETSRVPLRGRVLEPDGTPAAKSWIRLKRSGDFDDILAWSDDEGRFSTEVPPGAYTIVAVHDQYAPVRLDLVAVTEPLDGLEIRLRPAAVLTGQIPGLPEGARAFVRAERDGLSRSATAGPDGSYRFDNLWPGEWQLSVNVTGEGFVRNGKGSVTLSEATAGRFDFDLALGSASLSGRIGSDSDPILDPIQLLSPEGDEVASTSPGFFDGAFSFLHLRPGSYVLRITDRPSGRTVLRNVEISGNQEIFLDPRE